MIVPIFEKWRGKVLCVNVSPDVREPILMCWATLYCSILSLTQCIKTSGRRQCVLCVLTHRLGNKGPVGHLLPQPSLRREPCLWASGHYLNDLGVCWPRAGRHLGAYKFVFFQSSKSPSATFIPGDCVWWASGTMPFGMDILMYDNHLLRTFILHISLSEDKIWRCLSIKQVPLLLAKSFLGC